MASANLAVTVKVDLGITEPIFRALADVANARTDVERVIARGAFSALCEIQRMGDAARKALGIDLNPCEFVVRVREELNP